MTDVLRVHRDGTTSRRYPLPTQCPVCGVKTAMDAAANMRPHRRKARAASKHRLIGSAYRCVGRRKAAADRLRQVERGTLRTVDDG